MDLTIERYLHDEQLRGELERRAHRERAEQMHRYFAQAAGTLLAQNAPARKLRTDACG